MLEAAYSRPSCMNALSCTLYRTSNCNNRVLYVTVTDGLAADEQNGVGHGTDSAEQVTMKTDSTKPIRHDFPRVGPYEVITGDFHMHTRYSDGKLTTRQRVEESYNWGYDAIAVTDHGKATAYRMAKSVGEPLGMVVIRGFETGIAENEHLVVLNVPSGYTIRDPHNWAENAGEPKAFYQQELARIAKAGGIVIYPHPHVGYREPVLWGIGQGIIQGVEFKNGVVGEGWNTVKDHGTSWYPSAVDFAMRHNLAIMAHSDVHAHRQPDTSPVTLLLVADRSVGAVLDAIKAQRTAAWFNGMLWGREKLLSDLIETSVVVSRHTDGEIEFENRSPVTLSGSIGSGVLELGAYAKTTIEIGDRAETLCVKWDNVWIDLETNLSTEHGL
jgi:hypothetical protein